MKTMMKSIFAVSILVTCACANAGVVQIWYCTLNEGKSVDDVNQASTDWFAAAKTVKGGEKLEVYHEFPLAADAESGRFNFIMIAPDAETWGVFMDGYLNSEARKADEEWGEVATCSGGALWSWNRIR